MAATGYTPISLYYSTTASAVPTAGNLVAGELAININDGKLYFKNSSNVVTLLASTSGASGDVVGPASATDNAIARFDGTTGKLIQNSAVTIDDTTGSLTFTGSAARILGDFNNATLANRVLFQTSTTNANTVIGAIPNGTGASSQIALYASSDPANAAWLQLGSGANSGTEHRIAGTTTGTGSFLPLTMFTGGSERLRITTTGIVDIGGTSGGSVGELLVVEGANSAGHRSARINNTSTTNGYSTLWLGSSNDGILRGGSTAAAFTDQLALLTSGSNPITLYTNNTERMRIASDGKVGIGITTPTAALNVASANQTDNTLSALFVSDSVTTTKGVAIGYNATPNYGHIQSVNKGVAYTNLILQPEGAFVGIGVTSNITAMLQVAGSSSIAALKVPNIEEVATVSATAATGTINYDITTQSVLYYTSNASANWTVNFRGSSGTSLNTLMQTGESMSVSFLVTQGSTAYYNSSVQVDGTTSGVTTKWQGSAPTSGNANSIDSYTYVIIKTGSATFTVFATQTKFA